MAECADVSLRDAAVRPAPVSARNSTPSSTSSAAQIGTLITEPYLGGGGSYHPPKAYLQLLERFCREQRHRLHPRRGAGELRPHRRLFAFETYGIEPDIVVLGKGLGNGVPVAAAVGRADLFGSLDYGEGSDTWSANPLCCAAVLATLDEFERRDVLGGHEAGVGDRSRRAGRA